MDMQKHADSNGLETSTCCNVMQLHAWVHVQPAA